MRVGIPNRATVWTLRACSLVAVALAAWLWGILGVVGAAVLVVLVGRVWPKWASDLSWDDICVALCNLSEFGVNGSRLHLRFAGRQLFVGKDWRNGKKRLAVMLFTEEWKDLFHSPESLEAYAKDLKAA